MTLQDTPYQTNKLLIEVHFYRYPLLIESGAVNTQV